jgi:hypothetical protein
MNQNILYIKNYYALNFIRCITYIYINNVKVIYRYIKIYKLVIKRILLYYLNNILWI